MPGPGSSDPGTLIVAGSLLYFAAWDPAAGYGLHSLDITTVSPPAESGRRPAAVAESRAVPDGNGSGGFPDLTRRAEASRWGTSGEPMGV
jgi:hypothetical protein